MMQNTKRVYSVVEIQKILGIGRTRIYQYLEEVYKRQDPFKVIKIGKLYKIPKNSFDEWLSNN